jgi:hypothetical protein
MRTKTTTAAWTVGLALALAICGATLMRAYAQGSQTQPVPAGIAVPQVTAANYLKIDPLLVAQVAEVWAVIGREDNPVWPGWNAADTPILIYMPDVQDLLINHPQPPVGFTLYEGPIRFPYGKMWVKNGETIEKLDGQNTTRTVNGVDTLMVADSLSTRRQWVESVTEESRGSSDDLKSIIDKGLFPDPYGSMSIFAHEAFHVYQGKRAPQKHGSEFALIAYPSLSVENNVGYSLEADALRAAIEARDATNLRKFAVQWLAIRQTRRKGLSQALNDYEDGTEFSEGTANYVQFRFIQALEKRKPSPDMWFVQGFRGYDDLSAERERMLNRMSEMMAGKVNVNNDPYGASPVRSRLYFSGMGVGALLDRLGAKWHDRIFEPKTTLTALVEEALHATPQELQLAYAEVANSKRFKDLSAEKQILAKDGQAYIDKSLEEFDKAPGVVVLDYSMLSKPKVGVRFTPFGILRIDADRTLFRLIPAQGVVNGMSFEEDSARPLLQDRPKKQFVLTLKGAITEAKLDELAPNWRSGPVKIESLGLPGVLLKNVDASIKLEGQRLIIKALQ